MRLMSRRCPGTTGIMKKEEEERLSRRYLFHNCFACVYTILLGIRCPSKCYIRLHLTLEKSYQFFLTWIFSFLKDIHVSRALVCSHFLVVHSFIRLRAGLSLYNATIQWLNFPRCFSISHAGYFNRSSCHVHNSDTTRHFDLENHWYFNAKHRTCRTLVSYFININTYQ